MPTYPLVTHPSLDHLLAWRDGAPVSARAFLADVMRLAATLPPGGHVFNACTDRYRFAVGLCATLLAGKVSLLPPMQTPQMVRQLAAFAPDVFCLHDASACPVDLPAFRYPDDATPDEAPTDIPQIDAAQVMAVLFTSGSTGTPVPHRKTWGALVRCMRAGAARLGLNDGRAITLVGTVPAQHMYGFEVTVLLALQSGLAFSNRQPFYPADIREALDAVPQPRVLVTSPVHLRALLASEPTLPKASLVLSATAPLSEALAREAEARLAAPLIEIYGSTETGQIATRRTAQETVWHLYPEVRMESRPGTADDDGPTVWVSGGHVEAPVPMGDAIERLDDTQFLLHGRKTDLINIAGKRSSLAYLNHQLNAIPGVADGVFFMPDDAPAAPHARGGTAVTRLVALAVAPGLSAADVQRALHARIDAAFLPRPLLLVDALPRNSTGKLARDVLAALVAERAPPAPPAQHTARKPALRFTVPANHPALPGHFPGHPIVPGVVLLDHALHVIGAALGHSLDACRISAAKFLSPAAPEAPLDLAFETTASGAIRFVIRAAERDVASGVLSAPAPAQAQEEVTA